MYVFKEAVVSSTGTTNTHFKSKSQVDGGKDHGEAYPTVVIRRMPALVLLLMLRFGLSMYSAAGQ